MYNNLHNMQQYISIVTPDNPITSVIPALALAVVFGVIIQISQLIKNIKSQKRSNYNCHKKNKLSPLDKESGAWFKMLNKNFQHIKKILLIGILLFTVFIPTNIYAETNIPTRPDNGIYDPQHYLSQEVENKVKQHNETSDTPIGIYIVDTLDNYPIEDISNEVARKWKIGYKDVDKGVLIVIAIKDKRFRIETSDEVAVYLTDGESKSILNDTSKYMKQENYSEGVINLIDSVEKELGSEAQQKPDNKSNKYIDYFTLISIVIGTIYVLIYCVYNMRHPENATVGYARSDSSPLLLLLALLSLTDNSSNDDSDTNHWSGGGFSGGGSSGSW